MPKPKQNIVEKNTQIPVEVDAIASAYTSVLPQQPRASEDKVRVSTVDRCYFILNFVTFEGYSQKMF